MFWRKRIPKAKKGKFSNFEVFIFNHICSQLTEIDGRKLKEQLEFLTYHKRLDYRSSISLELYPETFNGIPRDFLFERTEEFKFATIKMTIFEQKYQAKIIFGMGSLFELNIKPQLDIFKIDIKDVVLVNTLIESNLSKNTN